MVVSLPSYLSSYRVSRARSFGEALIRSPQLTISTAGPRSQAPQPQLASQRAVGQPHSLCVLTWLTIKEFHQACHCDLRSGDQSAAGP